MGKIVYDDEEVDRLLDRSQEGVGETKVGANDYLSSFKLATFVVRDEEQDEPPPEEEKEVAESGKMVGVNPCHLMGHKWFLYT